MDKYVSEFKKKSLNEFKNKSLNEFKNKSVKEFKNKFKVIEVLYPKIAIFF